MPSELVRVELVTSIAIEAKALAALVASPRVAVDERDMTDRGEMPPAGLRDLFGVSKFLMTVRLPCLPTTP